MSVIVTCNAGSTNTKLAVFDARTLQRTGGGVSHSLAETIEWLCSIGTKDITAIGHRIVHGGRKYAQPKLITDALVEHLETYVKLAPLHQPKALALIREARKLYPHVAQTACFDTAFHATMPDIERRLPLPRWYHDEGIQRYGFHGLSYQHIANVLPNFTPASRVIVAHLGGGSSACAIKEGKSIASTMGFSTLDGMMMGTRCGALDAGVVLYLLQQLEMKISEVEGLLYLQSGLHGVSGISSDMQTLLKANTPGAREAVELYCHLAARQIAGLLPALGGMEALVFTGGIGENEAAIRESIASKLKWAGDVPVFVIPTDEELVIAESCQGLDLIAVNYG